ncbi:MAG: hypothetical protein IJV04_02970 [Lachnospiraceae bacterium]|nr:hypothetical protein [Lachnospiraceae bacterium]
MTGLEIALLLVGVLFFIGSFFFVEKLSSSDLETIQKMSEREVNILLEKQLASASDKIDRTLEGKFNESLNRFDRETNRRTTEEIFSISEHADTVSDSIEKKLEKMKEELKAVDDIQKKMAFTYTMLDDKQKTVAELEKEARVLESNLRNMKQSVEDAIERLYAEQKIRVETVQRAQIEAVPAVSQVVEEPPAVEDAVMEVVETEPVFAGISLSQVPAEPVVSDTTAARQEGSGNVNERILAMHREGFSDVDIARTLSKGVGEIRLVLGLYEE